MGLRPVGFEVDQAFIQVDVSEPGADKLADSGAGAEKEGEDKPISAGILTKKRTLQPQQTDCAPFSVQCLLQNS